MPSTKAKPYQQTPNDRKARDAAKLAGRVHYQPEHACVHGHTGVRYVRNGTCKTCSDKCTSGLQKKRRLLDRVNTPEKVLWQNAKDRSGRNGVDFSIQISDISVPKACPCCGKPFIFGAPTRYPVPQAPSLDRLDSSLGYEVQNIVVICLRCNQLKGDGTQEDHRQIADWMERHVRPSQTLQC